MSKVKAAAEFAWNGHMANHNMPDRLAPRAPHASDGLNLGQSFCTTET